MELTWVGVFRLRGKGVHDEIHSLLEGLDFRLVPVHLNLDAVHVKVGGVGAGKPEVDGAAFGWRSWLGRR
jgi:hypothetical protein